MNVKRLRAARFRAAHLRAKVRRLWRRRGISTCFVYSLVLHGVVLALLLAWPRLDNTATPQMVALIVDLIESESPSAGSPASGKDAAETAAAAAPAAPAATTPTAHTDATPTTPAPKGEEARPAQQQPVQQQSAAAIGDLLRGAEAAHGEAASSGSGGAGFTDSEDAGGTGTVSLKDFIRVQIERRWQVDPNAPNTQVTLRLVIAKDGVVATAEPLSDGGQDRVLRALALSARNAALLSSPLQFPRGTFAMTGEMIIDLNTRDARR